MFSYVLYAHSQYLCSSVSFKLSIVGVGHPSLLYCYSTRHLRSMMYRSSELPCRSGEFVLLPCFNALP